MTKTPTDTDTRIRDIANRFTALLEEAFGHEVLADIVRRNAKYEAEGSDACASHDFCDANDLMATACGAFLPSFDGCPETDDDFHFWDAAWDMARAEWPTRWATPRWFVTVDGEPERLLDDTVCSFATRDEAVKHVEWYGYDMGTVTIGHNMEGHYPVNFGDPSTPVWDQIPSGVEIGFVSQSEGCHCVDPFADFNGRPVTPEHHGFVAQNTGGGCMAHVLTDPDNDGCEWLLTGIDDAGLVEKPSDGWVLGYWKDGDVVSTLVVHADRLGQLFVEGEG